MAHHDSDSQRLATITAVLEGLIDECGLALVTETIATVCYEKAQHIAENWQDPTLSTAWTRVGGRFSTLATYLEGFDMFKGIR